MNIRKINIQSEKDVEKWVMFPYELYQDCKLWVPPADRRAEETA